MLTCAKTDLGKALGWAGCSSNKGSRGLRPAATKAIRLLPKMFEGFKFWDKMLTKNMESNHPHDWKQLILPSWTDRWMEEDVKRFSRTTEQVVVVLVLGKQPAKLLVRSNCHDNATLCNTMF